MDLKTKITAGLGRISEVFKVLLWEHAKQLKLSPIQIQILNFVAYHKIDLCNISQLAKEFNLTKPTISDAVKVLVTKELLIKDFSSADNRSYALLLSMKGKEVVHQTENLTDPIKQQLDRIEEGDLESLYYTLSRLIHQLNTSGILTVQRTCFGCKFYDETKAAPYCNLLEKKLAVPDIRLDCADYVKRGA